MTTQPEATAKSLTELVAEEIRVTLARRQMRQSELARALGVNEQWLSVRLRGLQPIDLNDLARIAAALRVAVTDLLPGAAEEVGPEEDARSKPMRTRPSHAKRGTLTTHGYGVVAERMTEKVTRSSHRPAGRAARDARPKGRVDSVAPAPTLRRAARIGSASTAP